MPRPICTVDTFSFRNENGCCVKLQVALRLFTKYCPEQAPGFVSLSLNDMGQHRTRGHWREAFLHSIAKAVHRKEIDLRDLIVKVVTEHNLSVDGILEIIRIDPIAALGLQSSVVNNRNSNNRKRKRKRDASSLIDLPSHG